MPYPGRMPLPSSRRPDAGNRRPAFLHGQTEGLNIMGYLTTHILDTAHGCPADGVHLTLRRIEDGVPRTLAATATNADGRCDEPLLDGAAFTAGQYEIAFAFGDYITGRDVALDAPSFSDVAVLRFGVAHADEHYLVPLLVSPYSNSPSRGS